MSYNLMGLLMIPKPKLQTIIFSNIAISRFVDKGDLNSARKVFDLMPERTVVSWNAIISGFSKCSRFAESLAIVSRMHRCDSRMNETTFSSSLSSCARSGYFVAGKQIHCLVMKSGCIDFEFVGTSLLNLYTSMFEIDNALKVFECLHCRNSLLWTAMLVGFVKCKMMDDALDLFDRMPSRDIAAWTAIISGFSATNCITALELFVLLVRCGEALPNEFTFDAVLRVCSKIGSLSYGKGVHGSLIKSGFETDSSIRGALVELYCKFEFEAALRIFHEILSPCSTISSAMIAGLLSAGRIADAEIIFRRISRPCPLLYNQMINAYAQIGRVSDAKNLFDEMPERNIASMNTMIRVHHHAGEFEEARKLFESVKEEKNTISWNSMISGFVQNQEPAEALKLYISMMKKSIATSHSTFSALFRACASIGALKQGMMVHAQLCKSSLESKSNVYVGTSLVDMYAKCGCIGDAKASFIDIVSPNIASWTALINGLAHHGSGTEALVEFVRMLKHGVRPNEVTFVGLIKACIREGKVNEGMDFFYSMNEFYGLVPTVEHYACVVDLLGRSGRVKEAEEVILNMPVEADSVIWGSLLNACWFFMDLEVGERVAWRLLCLDSTNVSTLVILSNIYAKIGRWEEVMKVRKRLRQLTVRKEPGCSWIEGKDTVNMFAVGNNIQPQRNEICSILEDLDVGICSYSENLTYKI